MRGVRVAECLRAGTARTALAAGDSEWSEGPTPARSRPLQAMAGLDVSGEVPGLFQAGTADTLQ